MSTLHYKILKIWLQILSELISKKYSKIAQYVFFSWWTSLMFKYSDFPRFSKDLDFAVSINCKKYDKQYCLLFSELKVKLEKFCEKEEIPVYSSFGNWREFIFQTEVGIASIKIDFMYDYILWYEKCCWLNKISDKDIFINKLQRLNKTDLIDLKFLYKKNKFSVDEIVNWIRKKWEKLYWNPYYLDNQILMNISKIRWFSFLKQLKNELG